MRGGGDSSGGVGIDGGAGAGVGVGVGASCSLQGPDRLAPEGLHLGTEMPLSG